jgi:TIR domain
VRGIFISYRRADSSDITQGIFAQLERRFRWVEIFKDVDAIPPGRDFVAAIQRALAHVSLMVVVLGPQWTSVRDGLGRRRLDNPADFVRLEVESGLRRGIPLVVLLADGAMMPEPAHLPPSLAPLAQSPAFPIRSGLTLSADLDRAIAAMTRLEPALTRWQPPYPRVALVAVVNVFALYCALALVAASHSLSNAHSTGFIVFGVVFSVAIGVTLAIQVYGAIKLVRLGQWRWLVVWLILGYLLFYLVLPLFGLAGPYRPVRRRPSAG